MTVTDSIVARLTAFKRAVDEASERRRQQMIAKWARDAPAARPEGIAAAAASAAPTPLQQQQQVSVAPPRAASVAVVQRPMSTPVYSVTWSCRLSTFSTLPLPW
jgi:hypothetical protein